MGPPAKKRATKRKRAPTPSRMSAAAPISEDDVRKLVGAAQLGLPLEIAAMASEVDPALAQEWIQHGRAIAKTTKRGRRGAQEQMCARLAAGWDAGLAKLVVVLQGYQIAHAKKDPAVAERLLAGTRVEYDRRNRLHKEATLRRSALKAPDLSSEIEMPVPMATAVHTERELAALNPGTVDAFAAEAATRSHEDLDYYARFGRWPEEEPEGIVIETDGETIDDIPDLAAELGTPGAAQDRDESLPVDETGQVVLKGREHVQDVAPAKIVNAPPSVPAYPPLRRVVDPADR